MTAIVASTAANMASTAPRERVQQMAATNSPAMLSQVSVRAFRLASAPSTRSLNRAAGPREYWPRKVDSQPK